jgi:hypothetical protein
MQNIRDALARLDSMEDDHWTQDGSPRIDAVASFLGSSVTRQQIIDAAPHFSRMNTVIPVNKEEPKDGEEGKLRQGEGDEEVVSDNFFDYFLNGDLLEEQDFVLFLNTVPSRKLNELEEILIQQNDQALKAMKMAEDLLSLTKRHLAYTRSRIKAEVPDISNQEAIRAYLQKQQELREQREGVAREVKKLIDIRKLDPRSAIDRAMARKTARGNQRPVRPLK